MCESVLLEMKNICKSFPGVCALDNVCLKVRRGEVHALLGENGAGKSTLIKILAGIYRADKGEIFIDGKELNIHDVNSSSRLAGVSVVHQELCLVNNLTVAENIFLGRVPVKKPFYFIDKKYMNKEAHKLCFEYGLDLDVETNLNNLSIAQQQMVELAKALSVDARIIVLDEPTGTLTEKEIIKLFEAINKLRRKGVAIIYISHRLEEIFRIADRASVLRDGKYIGTRDIKDISYHDLTKMMVGRELTEMYAKPQNEIGGIILEVRNINIGKKVIDASFRLNKGEILGFYGLIGSGRTELMQGVFGINSLDSGEVYIENKLTKIKIPQDAIDNGISLVPENRKEQGLILMQSITFNITIGIWKKIISWIYIKKKLEESIVNDYVKRLAIKTTSTDKLVGDLSGGNQQKVVISKGLATNPRILILDEPTRGIDVGAKKEIYEIMHNLVKEGVAIIMISSELPEIINMSRRVIVMHEGKIIGELSEEELTEEKIIIKATGGKQ